MKKNTFQLDKTVAHFNSMNNYSQRKGVVHSTDPEMLQFIKQYSKSNSKILEIGGGSGALLDLCMSEIEGLQGINVELAHQAYSHQVNPDIQIIGGNVLSLPFNDQQFDFVVIKNVFHHLVGNSVSDSKNNVHTAISEIVRVSNLNSA